jgi:hypothetical protein
MTISQCTHAVALVVSEPKEAITSLDTISHSTTGITANPNNNISEANLSEASKLKQHTLVLLSDTVPSSESNWICVLLMSFTTQMREWIALKTISRYDLIPIAPYILHGMGVTSALRIR